MLLLISTHFDFLLFFVKSIFNQLFQINKSEDLGV